MPDKIWNKHSRLIITHLPVIFKFQNGKIFKQNTKRITRSFNFKKSIFDTNKHSFSLTKARDHNKILILTHKVQEK